MNKPTGLEEDLTNTSRDSFTPLEENEILPSQHRGLDTFNPQDYLVAKRGVEPPRLSAHDPKSCVYTISPLGQLILSFYQTI